ncbi:hypothetical protein RJO21_002612 [Enterobacter hormaechei]|uniref:hypothetical protein n=1 Tax=Enterobacter cloacae complex TaxID=354276 RepID=UPI001369C334|nr:hypothetical protein [Enterobacter hormaechei]EKX4036204.1 hypothetical protein [Enterobacter cloacae]ELC6390918.1 hypothetical protein [Enterobacter hormaechei]MXS05019.1 hypothetical protein [Enterobacter hormaechei]HAS0892045.1 hypothetical protein [Enterobacter hormaechei subsp. steigerwaltii]
MEIEDIKSALVIQHGFGDITGIDKIAEAVKAFLDSNEHNIRMIITGLTDNNIPQLIEVGREYGRDGLNQVINIYGTCCKELSGHRLLGVSYKIASIIVP